jgi:hypothetical protein
MEKDKKVFSLIVKNTIFAILKEKYPDYRIDDSRDDKNILQITKLLRNLEKYSHIPDKQADVKKNFYLIKSFMENGTFREHDFLEELGEESKNLSFEDKEYILNSVIFVVNEDKKISDVEKEIILQIARFLNIELDYKTIIKHYKKSEFKKPMSTIFLIFIGMILLTIVAGVLFWQYQKIKKDNTNLFNSKKIVFNEVYFNKFIVYQNKFDIDMEHFKKYAVYYLSGKAEISFEPSRLKYNPLLKTVIYTHPEYTPFRINITNNRFLEIDKRNPKAISEQEAKKIAIGVGIAGAYLGGSTGKAGGSLLSKVIPPPYNKFSTVAGAGIGGIFGGVGSYYISLKSLDGLKLSKDITEKEKIEVQNTGRVLIKAQILLNEELQSLYKKNFEEYIRSQYSQYGKKVKSIQYKVEK